MLLFTHNTNYSDGGAPIEKNTCLRASCNDDGLLYILYHDERTPTAQELFDTGKGFYESEDYKSAITELEQAIDLDNSNAEVYILLAKSYYSCGDKSKAVKIIKLGMKNADDTSELESLLAEYSVSETETETTAESTYIHNETFPPIVFDEDTGDMFTVMSWNLYYPELGMETFVADGMLPDGVYYNPVNFNVGGTEAIDYYDNYMASGEDLDIFAVESEWAKKYMNSSCSVGMSSLGIYEKDLENCYSYTVDLAKDDTGEIYGIASQCSPGFYAYRSDLAKKYLGVNSPEEMQTLVKDWSTFTQTAKSLKDASDGQYTMVASLDDIWKCYTGGKPTPWVENDKLNISRDMTSFMELAKELVSNEYINKNEMAWTENWCRPHSNSTMGYFFASWCVETVLTIDSGSDNYGTYRIVPGPSGYYWGLEYLCVSSTTDNPSLCAEYLNYLVINSETAKRAMDYDTVFINNKQAIESIINDGGYRPDVLGNQEAFSVYSRCADNIRHGALTQYDSIAYSAFYSASFAYAKGEMNYDDAISYYKSYTDIN